MNPKFIHYAKHQRDKMVGATLADNLRQQYKRRSVRVIKGDSVRVMRGEYRGVEGKVEKVNTENGTLQIEGVQHEKVRGGQVKVPIHASNVMVTSLKTDDKYRSTMLSSQQQAAPAPQAEKPAEAKEEKKPKAAAKKAPAKAAKKAKPAKTAKKAKAKAKPKKKEATS
ncbi:MAG: 50S ribosomal protein L24 [Nitrososphaera sp.]|uniref:50S ribosomal protein L24 n=1 Tax=Nitrososphaera sp. TaxID=1971748 RepID=UPI003D6E9D3F